MEKPRVYAVQGDITKIPADALMAAIRPGGSWHGNIDNAIYGVAGQMYHNQAAELMPLKNLQTVVARGSADHNGNFRDVVFVVDEVISPLEEVVYRGLEAASNENYKSLLIPTIRTGAMAGVRETPEQAVRAIAKGLEDFVSKYSGRTKLEDVKVVVYYNPKLTRTLSSALKKI